MEVRSDRTPQPARGCAVTQAKGAAGPREAVFHVRGISKVYRMGDVEVHALHGVDLDLFAGEFVVLLGPACQKHHSSCGI